MISYSGLDKVSDVALESLKIVKKLGTTGKLIVSLIELFVDDIPDPEKDKLK